MLCKALSTSHSSLIYTATAPSSGKPSTILFPSLLILKSLFSLFNSMNAGQLILYNTQFEYSPLPKIVLICVSRSEKANLLPLLSTLLYSGSIFITTLKMLFVLI